jgi:uncharacterized protein YukE
VLTQDTTNTTEIATTTPDVSPARIRFIASLAGEADCVTCGWDAATLNSHAHEKRCRRWTEASLQMGYSPMTTSTIKTELALSREEAEATEDSKARLKADMRLMQALYDRSVGNAFKNKTHMGHPTLEEYISMVHLDELGDELRASFPYTPGHIGPTFTMWEPEDSRARKMQERAARHRMH